MIPKYSTTSYDSALVGSRIGLLVLASVLAAVASIPCPSSGLDTPPNPSLPPAPARAPTPTPPPTAPPPPRCPNTVPSWNPTPASTAAAVPLGAVAALDADDVAMGDDALAAGVRFGDTLRRLFGDCGAGEAERE